MRASGGAAAADRRRRRRQPPTPLCRWSRESSAIGCVAMSMRYSPVAFSCTVMFEVTRSRVVSVPVITRVFAFCSACGPPSAWTYFARI